VGAPRAGSTLTKPTFQGAATVAMAREVYGICDPDEKQLSLF